MSHSINYSHYWCTVVSCLMVLPAVIGFTCVGVAGKEVECGSFTHPNCKFSAKYLTIKPDGIDSGFGDAYFDTNDIDIELRCSFRTPEAGKMTVAIISFEDNYENALAEFHKKIKNGRGKVEILAENQGLIEKDAVIKTNATLLSIDRTPNKTYTCLCPHVIYKYVNESRDSRAVFTYLTASKVHASNFSRSSSFYTVPLYEPCKVETCSDINNEQMDYCYETKTGPSLGEMNPKEIHKLLNYCENRGIKKNWVTEDWTEEWKERMANVLKWDNAKAEIDKKLYHLASKSVAEHFCNERELIIDWASKYHIVRWYIYNSISNYMLNTPSFPWFDPDEDEIGSLLLSKSYKNVDNGEKEGEYMRCKHHIEILKSLTSNDQPEITIPKFFAKTYPTCIDSFVGIYIRDVDYNFELFFNDKDAFYDSKHFSVENGNNTLVLKIMPHEENMNKDENINDQRTFKFKAVDCSLYSWKRSKGIQHYSREKLENITAIDEKKSTMTFQFNINSTKIGSEDKKTLVGCYIEYNYFCNNQNCDNITRLKKLQFYVEPAPILAVIPNYAPVTLRLTECKDVDQRFVWKPTDDGNGNCECVSKISLCSPLKTTHEFKKSFPCVGPTPTNSTAEPPAVQKSGSESPKPEKDNTTLFVILSVIGVLLFITGIAVAMFFNSKKKNNEEVRVLTLIEQEPETQTNSAGDENKFFDSEIQSSSELTSTDKKCDANETTSQTTNNTA